MGFLRKLGEPLNTFAQFFLFASVKMWILLFLLKPNSDTFDRVVKSSTNTAAKNYFCQCKVYVVIEEENFSGGVETNSVHAEEGDRATE